MFVFTGILKEQIPSNSSHTKQTATHIVAVDLIEEIWYMKGLLVYYYHDSLGLLFETLSMTHKQLVQREKRSISLIYS